MFDQAEKLPKNEDDFELNPDDDILDQIPDMDLDLGEDNIDSSPEESSAKTETIETIKEDYIKLYSSLENKKADLVKELLEDGIIDKRKRWDSVLFIFNNYPEKLTKRQVEDIEYILNEGLSGIVEKKKKIESLQVKKVA